MSAKLWLHMQLPTPHVQESYLIEKEVHKDMNASKKLLSEKFDPYIKDRKMEELIKKEQK